MSNVTKMIPLLGDKALLTASNDGCIAIWDLEVNRVIGNYTPVAVDPKSLRRKPENAYIASFENKVAAVTNIVADKIENTED